MIVSPLFNPATASVPTALNGPATGAFAEALGGAIGAVEETRASARNAASDLLLGGKGDIHTIALQAQRAELTLELFQQVRNKFVTAYQEIMKMPM